MPKRNTADDTLNEIRAMRFDFSEVDKVDTRTADVRDLVRGKHGKDEGEDVVPTTPKPAKTGKEGKRACTINLPNEIWDKLEEYEFYLKRVQRKRVTHTEVIAEALDQFLTKKLKKFTMVIPACTD